MRANGLKIKDMAKVNFSFTEEENLKETLIMMKYMTEN